MKDDDRTTMTEKFAAVAVALRALDSLVLSAANSADSDGETFAHSDVKALRDALERIER